MKRVRRYYYFVMVEPTFQGPTGTPAAVAKGAVDPEVAAVKLLLKLLEKAFKSSFTSSIPISPLVWKPSTG